MNILAEILDKMMSYRIVTKRKPIYIQSPYLRDVNYVGFLTEYSASLSPDTDISNESSNTSKKRSIRIEDEMLSLLYERKLSFNQNKMELSFQDTFLYWKISVTGTNKITDQLEKKDDEKINEGYMSQMPDEIIMKLFKYVHGMDRVNLGSTCKRFRHLLLHTGLLWKTRRIVWRRKSRKYAVLARQIGKLVIVLATWKDLDKFCLDLFSAKQSHTSIIHIIQPQTKGKCQPIFCWIRTKTVYQKYQIHPRTELKAT